MRFCSDNVAKRKCRTPTLIPPRQAVLPLWLALLLKRQRRADIVPPAWMNTASLNAILDLEKRSENFAPGPPLPTARDLYSSVPPGPPFLPHNLALGRSRRSRKGEVAENAIKCTLPYHWLEISHLLLRDAGDNIEATDVVARLIRDLKEVRMAKLRTGLDVLEGTREIGMTGVGGLEVAECRSFITGVIDGLRLVGASAEAERRERADEDEDDDNALDDGAGADDPEDGFG